MDREWLYKQVDELTQACVEVSKMLDVQTRLIEDLVDRVASLEECARLAPTKAVRRSKTNKGVAPLPLSLPGG